jgi:hypothetical protein
MVGSMCSLLLGHEQVIGKRYYESVFERHRKSQKHCYILGGFGWAFTCFFFYQKSKVQTKGLAVSQKQLLCNLLRRVEHCCGPELSPRTSADSTIGRRVASFAVGADSAVGPSSIAWVRAPMLAARMQALPSSVGFTAGSGTARSFDPPA